MVILYTGQPDIQTCFGHGQHTGAETAILAPIGDVLTRWVKT